MIGQRLGPYEITAKLGEGGMGEVWRARDTKLDRDVAIKVLPAAFVEDHERLARFEREAKLLALLNHPNIAHIYGMEATGEAHALVMELVEGPTLAERLESGPLPFNESLSLARQIAEALEEAHEKGIIHRDLKPQNIKASVDGKVKVLDFGLAKAMETRPAASLSASELGHSPTITLSATHEGVILGTAAYMSPEQARGLPADKRTDIWAFGVVVFEMLAGGSVFASATVPDTLAAVLMSEIDWSRLPAATPSDLRRLLERCLERDPRNRLHDIADARLELEAIRAKGSAALRPVPGEGAGQPLPIGMLLGVAVLAAALGLAVGAVLSRRAARAVPTAVAGSSIPRFVQRTFRQNAIFNARYGPDGRTIVFSATVSGPTPELFVVRPEYPEPQPLGLEATHLLSVSSRGELAVLTGAKAVAFRMFIGTLSRVPLGGGTPREVARDVREADWTPDGSELAVIRRVEGSDRLELPLGTLLHESSGYLSDLRVSPDGRAVAFFEHPQAWDDRGAVAVVDRAGKVTRLSNEFISEQGLAWSADGGEVCFSADEGQGLRPYCSRAGSEPTARLASAGALLVQDIARDGRWLVTRDELWFSVRVRAPGAPAERDLSWLDYSTENDISRDGRWLLLADYSSVAGSSYNVVVRRTDGSPAIRLGEGEPHDFSPNGQFVSVSVPGHPVEAVAIPVGAGTAQRLDHGEFDSLRTIKWFPDNATTLLCGVQKGLRSRCYRRDPSDGTLRAVTPEGTQFAWVSSRGDRILALLEDESFVLVSASGDEAIPVASLGPADRVVRWSPDDRSIWVRRRYSLPARLESLDLATGVRRHLFDLGSDTEPGVVMIVTSNLSDDPNCYSYTIQKRLSHLFEVEGVP